MAEETHDDALQHAGETSTTLTAPPPPNAPAAPISASRTPALAFGRTWGPMRQADGSLKVEIRIQPEVADYLISQAEMAGEPLPEHIQKVVDEALAMYTSQ